MVNYGNGKIYKLIHMDGSIVYIGSTTKQYLCQRLVNHKAKARTVPNRKIYKHISNTGNWDSYKIELVEPFPCNSKDELTAREGYFIRMYNPVGNIHVPGRTLQQYRADNIERLTKYGLKYRADNKEKIRERKSRTFFCECGSISTFEHKLRHEQTKKHQAFIATN